jgi:putative alpha-1,2-mannosidase
MNFLRVSRPVIRFDLGFAINWDRPTETFIQYINDSTIVGYRYSSGWAKTQRVYFAAITSVPFTRLQLADGKERIEAKSAKGAKIKAHLVFEDMNGRPISMKVGLSSVSTDKALSALDEITGWDFNAARKAAETKWESELSKITISSADEEKKKIFYTALYHTCMAPVLYSDADGTYQNAKGQVLKMAAGQRYTELSLWDTFRCPRPPVQPDTAGEDQGYCQYHARLL